MSNGPIPLLFLGDAPSLPSGLSRIGRDLALVAATLPEFRVGFMGRGGIATSQLPFMQYNYPEFGIAGQGGQWGEHHIEQVWQDFAGEQPGVIFTIWDPSRLDWFGMPQHLPDGALKTFLMSGRFQRWGYFPIDGYGIGGKLSKLQTETLRGFDRVLAYGPFGSRVIGSSLDVEPVEWMPHGFNDAVFKRTERYVSDLSDSILVGCVMTNQARKDWGVAFRTFDLLKLDSKWKFWCHTDSLDRYWDFRALIADFDLVDSVRVTMTGDMTDTQLAMHYSQCDITILPSLGEGFGYPIVESLACGVPVVHINYAGGADLPCTGFVNPNSMRLDTRHNIVRPVLSPTTFAGCVEDILDYDALPDPVTLAESVSHLAWRNLAPRWKTWFRAGIK